MVGYISFELHQCHVGYGQGDGKTPANQGMPSKLDGGNRYLDICTDFLCQQDGYGISEVQSRTVILIWVQDDVPIFLLRLVQGGVINVPRTQLQKFDPVTTQHDKIHNKVYNLARKAFTSFCGQDKPPIHTSCGVHNLNYFLSGQHIWGADTVTNNQRSSMEDLGEK